MDVLETTLRDGSYAVNFQFTASDTALIAAALEKAGFKLIEIGHGVGLNASSTGQGTAAETDEGYLAAAAESLKHAKFGMFCIPGIARIQDVDMASEFGMGFLRVGTDVAKVHESQAFIERAKSHGMFVCANFMKSYASSPELFAAKATLSEKYGADVLYIVDSSGGMLPSDVEAYFQAVRRVSDIPLAFHSHNNLGLAIANTMRAIELGATIIDTSLQGMGRSSGNASTEIAIALLSRMGIECGIDLMQTLDIGEKYIRPLIRRRGLSSLDIIAGLAQFHSSYMGTIRKSSSKYRVDPRELILSLCKVNKTDAPPDLVDSLARQLSRGRDEVSTARYEFDEYVGAEQNDPTSVAVEQSLPNNLIPQLK